MTKTNTKTPSKKVIIDTGPDQVAEFIQNLKHPLKNVLVAVREIILSADKGITEHIKWNAPSFCFQDDDRITTNLHKSECIILVFHRGVKVKDNKSKDPLFNDTTGLLQWISPDRATAKFVNLSDVASKKADLKKVVKQWVKIAT